MSVRQGREHSIGSAVRRRRLLAGILGILCMWVLFLPAEASETGGEGMAAGEAPVEESGQNPAPEKEEPDAEARTEEEIRKLEEKTKEELLSEMDFSEMDKVLEDLFPDEKLDFGGTVRAVMSGELELDVGLVNKLIADQLFYAFRVNKRSIIQLIAIAAGAAVFLNFSNVFQTRQVSEISFFLLYMLLVGICLTSFQAASDWVRDGIGQLTGFMKILYPVYFAAVTAAKGSVAASAFYHLALLLILVIDGLIMHVMLPVIHIYVMVRVLNSLQPEDYLSKLSELLDMAAGWLLKSLLGCMIGLNVIQGMVAPAIDTVKRSVVTRSVEAIPGVGDALGGTAEVVLGTAVLIKNSIGLTGALICCALCAVPLIQLAVITLAYKFTAAVIQPVSDKRIVECISGAGDGCRMLLKAVFTSGVLFLLTIAIAVYTTSSV